MLSIEELVNGMGGLSVEDIDAEIATAETRLDRLRLLRKALSGNAKREKQPKRGRLKGSKNAATPEASVTT